jgi:hypothetical protein
VIQILSFLLLVTFTAQAEDDFDYTSPNFKECLSIWEKAYSSDKSADACIKKVKAGHDFLSKNFQACQVYYGSSLLAPAIADHCIDYVEAGVVFLDNANLSQCFRIYQASVYDNVAIAHCLNGAPKIFDFLNENFTSCLTYFDKNLNTKVASDRCIVHVNDGYNFLSKQFDECFKIYFRSLTGHEAAAKCLTKKGLEAQTETSKPSAIRVEESTVIPVSLPVSKMDDIDPRDLPKKISPFDPPETEYK